VNVGELITSVFDFASMPMGVVVAELDGSVVAANAAAVAAGWPEAGRIWFGSPQLASLWTRLAREGGEVEIETDLHAVRRTIRVATMLRSFQGHAYVVAVMTDTTERAESADVTEKISRRDSNQIRLASNERLESLGLVAGGVAHEFNNQLVSVVSEASMLREDDHLGEEPREAIGRIEAAARRMTLLTKQLLAFAGRGRFVTVLLDPDQLLQDTRHRLTRMVPPTVMLQIDPGAPEIAIEADRGLLRQVVLDLVENSVDAVRGAGTIRVVTSIIDGCWQLVIADDGVGMDSLTLNRMFDPFFSTKADHRGLGLSAVLGIVRRLGGDITASSQPGRGTTVQVQLPIVLGAQAPRRRSTSEQPPMEKLTGLKILVADDEPSVRQTIQRFLIRRSAVPVIACDGAEAEELLRSQHFDVVLLDVMMPKKTGYQLIPIVRETQPGTPVILMSGYSEQPDSAEQPDAFIEKPFSVSTLEGTIQSAMRGDVAAERAGTED
jgi:two-component system, cell cycle sensor histidine kinase and response regulator CckA